MSIDIIADLERQRDALREEVEEERAAFDELIDGCESWQRANAIRGYLAAVSAWAKNNGKLDEHLDWLSWAHEQADRIDPLRPSSPSVLDIPYEQYRKLRWNELLNEDGEIERIFG